MITYGNGSDNLSKGTSTAIDACTLAQNSGTGNLAKTAGTAVNNFAKGVSAQVDALEAVFDWDEFIILTT